MSFTAEQAKLIASTSLADFENETAATKRVIGAIPAGKESYTPDPKSMTAIDLAWHLASTEPFFLHAAADGKFTGGENKRPDHIRSAQDVLAWYESNLPAALARAKGASGEQLAQMVDFFGVMQLPAAAIPGFMVRHSVHHRGQLSAYLRPMGAKVPSIYGPSADTK